MKIVKFAILFLIMSVFMEGFSLEELKASEPEYPWIYLEVSPDFSSNIIHGLASWKIPQKKAMEVDVRGLFIEEININGQMVSNDLHVPMVRFKPKEVQREVKIKYKKKIPSSFQLKNGGIDVTLGGDIMDKDFLALIGAWFPRPSGLCKFSLKVRLPLGFKAVSEADSIKMKRGVEENLFEFYFPYPRKDISLVAGKYEVKTAVHKGKKISVYFFPEDIALSEKYIAKAKGFLDRYEALLTPYPFKSFAIVENRLPTGYGFPTYTLLGQQVARLPFIADISLGHEILHCWFGNSVYVNMEQGNWSEGLTTYLSDYLYKEEQGKGREYRKELLADYQSYVHEGNAFPLSKFSVRTDRASKAVGYGKGAMFFHMLKEDLGEKIFYEGLKQFIMTNSFKVASWEDMKRAFEKASGRDIAPFFDQWLRRKDVPELKAKDASFIKDGDKYRIRLEIQQQTQVPYHLNVPVVIRTKSGEVREKINLFQAVEIWETEFRDEPMEVIMDQDFEVMRKLSLPEFPVSLSRLLGEERKFYVHPAQDEGIYAGFIALLKTLGFEEWKGQDIPPGSFISIGGLEPSFSRIFGKVPGKKEGVTLMVKKNPFDKENVLSYLYASSRQELDWVQHKLLHYGKYSFLEFNNGKIQKKEMDSTDDGIKFFFRDDLEAQAISSKNLSTIQDIISDIANKKIIFVGEQHNNFSHHLTQLEIIKGIHAKGKKIAIGMEMFQRPFQSVIEKYLGKEIDEDEFLKKTEYFKRWGFDYQLYRPIIKYARANHIPVIALNLSKEISEKVARTGINSLSEEEFKEVPKEMDFSRNAYRDYLKEVFRAHPESKLNNFDYFYQAQVLWDEVMAKSVHEFLRENPGYQMVVLAGEGHLSYGHGIPSRTKRLGGYDQAIILNGVKESLDPDMADYFIFVKDVPAPFSAKLGVLVEEREDAVVIQEVLPHGAAKKASLQKGDVLVAFNKRFIKGIFDLKIALLYVNENDTVTATIKRDKLMKLKIGPFVPVFQMGHSPHLKKNQKP